MTSPLFPLFWAFGFGDIGIFSFPASARVVFGCQMQEFETVQEMVETLHVVGSRTYFALVR